MSEVDELATPIDPMSVRDALITAWSVRFNETPANSSIALLLAQIGLETGWKECKNFNIGNAKHVAGNSDDYCSFLTEERFPVSKARSLAQTPGATLKTTVPDADGMLTIELPQMFRAFPNLTSGVAYYLGLLSKKFAGAWTYVIAGDLESFVNALKAESYFTASVSEYIVGVYRNFGQVACEWLGFSSVAAFQKAHGLAVDNVCGPNTTKAMMAALNEPCDDVA